MTDEQPSDIAVLAAARSGDARSFALVFDRHRDRVFGHALRLTRERADAEDATAVTFLELWRKQGHVRDVDGSVLPWLLVTTTNVVRNLHRSSRRYRAALAAIPRTEDAHEPTGSDLDLRDALLSLPIIDQRLLSLTLEGYSTSEAAQVLGLSSGAARTRMTRARQRLRDLLHPGDASAAVSPSEGIR